MPQRADDDLIRWSALSEPGDKLAGAIYRIRPDLIRGDLSRLANADALRKELQDEHFADYLHGVAALAERLASRLATVNVTRLCEVAENCGAIPVDASSLPDSLFRNLSRLGDSMPLVLWLTGNIDALQVAPRLAIVGTRIPSSYSERIVRRSVASFSSEFCLISGGALGVDALAHRAALDAEICSIAFLAGGIDRPYPDSHAGLFSDIALAGGAIVTEAPPGTAPTRWRFLQRNRVIAAACDLLVVTEAGARSGARNTVHHANECGVRVMIAPGPIDSETSKGTNLMLAEQLGEPLLEPQILEAAFLSGNLAVGPAGEGDSAFHENELNSDATRVLDALRAKSTLLEISRESGLELRVVSKQLEYLATSGRVFRDGIRWVRQER